MTLYFIQIVITSLMLLLMANLVKGVEIDDWPSALIAAIVLGVINAIVKPVLVLLTIPLTVVTLGLFLLVVNALMLRLAAALSPGVHVAGFGPAFFGSVVLTILNLLLVMVVGV